MKTTPQCYLTTSRTIVALLLSMTLPTKAQLTHQMLYSFPSSGSEPRNPHAGLVEASDGLFCGTAYAGGAYNLGAVYQISAAGVLLNYSSFNQTNGSRPESSLVRGPGGDFYGTSTNLGSLDGLPSFARGTVFRYQPTNKLELQFAFRGTNYPIGSMPVAGLLATEEQLLLGTTFVGGTMHPFGRGTIFALRTNGALTYFRLFGNTNGAFPCSKLMRASDSSFYGTTSSGGEGYVVTNTFSSTGYGVIYRMSRYGNLDIAHSFTGTNGSYPYGGLAQAVDGLLYGTTRFGGNGFNPVGGSMTGNGTVFSLTTNGVFTSLFKFNGTDGAQPMGDLLPANDGFIYGTTYGNSVNNYGTVFRITTNGTFTTLVTFYNTNGAYPIGGLIQALDGNLYGTTSAGGASGAGTVFRLIQPPRFAATSLGVDGLTLSWNSAANVSYRIESASKLLVPDWTILLNHLTATGGTAFFTDPSTDRPARYYRVMMRPQ